MVSLLQQAPCLPCTVRVYERQPLWSMQPMVCFYRNAPWRGRPSIAKSRQRQALRVVPAHSHNNRVTERSRYYGGREPKTRVTIRRGSSCPQSSPTARHFDHALTDRAMRTARRSQSATSIARPRSRRFPAREPGTRVSKLHRHQPIASHARITPTLRICARTPPFTRARSSHHKAAKIRGWAALRVGRDELLPQRRVHAAEAHAICGNDAGLSLRPTLPEPE